jgi:dTDP-4-dehydrorhamnose 3,5-epimerase
MWVLFMTSRFDYSSIMLIQQIYYIFGDISLFSYYLYLCHMEVIKTSIEGVLILEPKVFGDHRGYFFESFSQREFDEKVREVKFVQDNESKSSYGVLRGLHFQKPPHVQSKLVRVVKGAVLDVAVDIRKGSPTFGKHVAVELTAENHRQLFVPRGFAHGFVVLSDEVVFQYKCDNFYAPEFEGAIAWDDPDLGIDWRIPADKVILSAKDTCHPCLKDAEYLFDYNENLY